MSKKKTETDSGFLKAITKIIAFLLLPIVVLSKFLLDLSYIFIPRSVTDLVPMLNVNRKYLLYASKIFSSDTEKEMMDVQESVDDLLLTQEKIREAYPIQRSIGELFDKLSTLVLLVLLPILVWKQPYFDILKGLKPIFGWFYPIIVVFVFSTIQGMLSGIATFFGPIFRFFHKTSLTMLKFGSYRAGYYYQKLEDLFALPFLASKSSYRFIDAPPVSQETFEDFQIDLKDDVNFIKQKIQNLVSMHGSSLSSESKELCKNFLIQIDRDKVFMEEVESSISRTFALLIWKRQESIYPWVKKPALKKFAEINNMKYKEAKNTLSFVTNKLEDKFVSDNFYQSILLTGVLRGIWNLETKHDTALSDSDFSQLAFSIAIGSQRYIVDTFKIRPFYISFLYLIRNILLAIIAPVLTIGEIFLDYFRHIKNETSYAVQRGKRTKFSEYVTSRYKEMNQVLYEKLTQDEDEKETGSGEEGSASEKKRVFLRIMKLIVQVVLALPFSLYYIIKAIVSLFKIDWKKKTAEERNKRKFEKDLSTETLAAMYQEIYEKMVLQTYYYS